MPKRILQGTVISDKADKTISVLVERRYKHPTYKKYITKTKKYSVHDANNTHKIGDIVEIIEHKPISKTKKWIVKDNKSGDQK
jgi:small subunit ribosomal protein S17